MIHTVTCIEQMIPHNIMKISHWIILMTLFSASIAMTSSGMSTVTEKPASWTSTQVTSTVTALTSTTTVTVPEVTSTVPATQADVLSHTTGNTGTEKVTDHAAGDEMSTQPTNSDNGEVSDMSTLQKSSEISTEQNLQGVYTTTVSNGDMETTSQPLMSTTTMTDDGVTNSSIVSEEYGSSKIDVRNVTDTMNGDNVTSSADESLMRTTTPSGYFTTEEVTMTSSMLTDESSDRSTPSNLSTLNGTETSNFELQTTSSIYYMITNGTTMPKTDVENSSTIDTQNLTTSKPQLITSEMPVTVALIKKLTFKFVLSGNCTALSESNFSLTNLFAILKLSVGAKLDITNWNITVSNEICDSDNNNMTALFAIFTQTESETIKSLAELNNVSFSVMNDTIHINLIEAELISSEEINMATTTSTAMIPKLKDSTFKLTFNGDCFILLPELRSFIEETTIKAGDVTEQHQTTFTPMESNGPLPTNGSAMLSNETMGEGNNTKELEQISIPIEFNQNLANLSSIEQFKIALDLSIKNIFDALNLSAVFSTSNITCGSVIVYLTVYNTSDNVDIHSAITNLTDSNFVIYVKNSDNNYYKYTLSQVDTMSSPWLPTTVAMQPKTTTKTRIETEEGLNEVEIIIIIVFGVIGSCLLLIIIGFVIYRCYITRNSKTFTLTDTPNSELRLEDFTLTKLNRPVPIYTDQGVIMPPASVKVYNKGPSMPYKQTVPYNNPMYLQENNSRYNSNRNSGVDHLHRTSTENLVPKSQPRSSPGIENPSFSSDDILDSGSNTSTDLPYDGKVDPNVRAEGMERF